jgi:hypothetical protein
MPLLELNLPPDGAALPADVRSFLSGVARRIEQIARGHPIPAFVPSDYEGAYRVLRALAEVGAPGELFCEWGSGLGVVACLAAMLDFDACGIEIEGELVDAAQELADDFGLPVQFVRGSFIPASEPVIRKGEFSWLATDGTDGHEELGLDPSDFAVIFAYPWPDEEGLTEKLFERHGRAGAVLMTHHGGETFRLRRKARSRGRR